MRIILLSATTLLLNCATTGKYEEKLRSWVGRPESELLKSWGPPDQSYPNGEGKIITYKNNYGTKVNTGSAEVTAYDVYCNTSFYLTKDSVIEYWRWKGNDCVSY